MNGIRKKTAITEADIEEMCLLAEDVMHELYVNYADYDAEGNSIFEKYYDTEGDCEEEIRLRIREERRKMYEDVNCNLLDDLFRRGDDIGEVRCYTREDVLPWIGPIIPKALQIFRKGTGSCGETDLVVKESVPDDYLIAIFAREVRNMMMIFAGQKLQRENSSYYLLMLAAPSCHDGDEWMGTYYDDENLKKAYDRVIAVLEEKKKNDRNYCAFHVEIWEFREIREYDTVIERKKGKEDYEVYDMEWKQHIRLVKPEKLRCFSETLYCTFFRERIK